MNHNVLSVEPCLFLNEQINSRGTFAFRYFRLEHMYTQEYFFNAEGIHCFIPSIFKQGNVILETKGKLFVNSRYYYQHERSPYKWLKVLMKRSLKHFIILKH